jgi:WD40 repeat protein
MSDTIEVFISYSKQDEELRDGLLAHLHPLERQGIISWHDRQILPGTRWDEEIKARLNAADIILLLISADFLNTDYCNQVEIPEALRRHEAGEATVMPVILRSCGWKYTPLAAIQAYPEKAKPIVSWTHIDDAYTDVLEGVYLAATEIEKKRAQKAKQVGQVRYLEQKRQEKDQERLQLAQKEAERERIQLEQQRAIQLSNEDLSSDEELLTSQIPSLSPQQISPSNLKGVMQESASNSSKEIVNLAPTHLIQKNRSKEQTQNTLPSKKRLKGSEELEEIIKIVDKAFSRKTRMFLNDTQRNIVQGAWYGLSYEKIANTSKHNPAMLESRGRRLWEILSESLGENINKSNFRSVMKPYLLKSRTSLPADKDKKSTGGSSTQICEYVSTLSGHSGWVNSIVVSSSRQIISGGQDKTVKIWELDTGKHLRDLGNFFLKGHSDRVNSIAISPDNIILASASEDRTVKVWDLVTYGRVYQLNHRGAVHCVTISPDNQFLASGCSNHEICIWHLGIGKEIKRFAERDAIKALAFSPDGQTLIGATEDKTIKTWLVQNWSQQNLFFDYESSPDSFALSKDGNILAISYKNRKIKVINLDKREHLYSLSGQVVAISPDSEIFATALDKEISLWKQETGELICPPIKVGNLVNSLAFSSDGLILVSGQGKEIKIWQIRKDKLLP